MARSRTTADEQALCPVAVARRARLSVHELAQAMKVAGRTTPLTRAEIHRWRHHPGQAPDWYIGVLVARAVRDAQRAHRRHVQDQEAEHALLLREHRIWKRLRAGATRFCEADREILYRLAMGACRDLARECGDRCGGPVPERGPDDAALLRWAGVDPGDHTTWPIHRGDCELVRPSPPTSASD